MGREIEGVAINHRDFVGGQKGGCEPGIPTTGQNNVKMVGNGPLDSRLNLSDFIGMNSNWEFAPDIGQHGFPGGDSVRSGSSALGGGFFCLGVRPGFFEEIFRGANFGTTLFGLFFQGLWALARRTTRWP